MSKRPLFIYFGGTGSPVWFRGGRGDSGPACLRKHKLENKFNMNGTAVRLYFEGCHHPKIGGKVLGGDLDPDLTVVSNTLRQCFDGKTLDLHELKRRFGNAVRVVTDDGEEPTQINVEKIVMSGYSRGGVTCFSAAQALNDLDIHMHAFAQDPVPGNTPPQAQQKDSLYLQNHDLTQVRNLKTLTVSVGRYFKNVAVQNHFFRQMIPKTGEQTARCVFATNRSHHLYMINKLVLCEFEAFLREHEIATSKNYRPEELEHSHHRMLQIPTSSIHPHLYGGDLREILDPPSHISFETNWVNQRLGNNTLKHNAPAPQRKALFRLTLRDENPSSELSTLLKGNEEACICLLELESYLCQNTRGKNLSDRQMHALNDGLKKIDLIILETCKGTKKRNTLALFNDIRNLVEQTLSALPLALHANVQRSIRQYLATNPLKLESTITDSQQRNIDKHRCDFTSSLLGTLFFATVGTGGGITAGIFLPTLLSVSSYAVIMAFVATSVVAVISLASVMTDRHHARCWTLPQPKKAASANPALRV